MKVEIELSEVEFLRNQIIQKDKEIKGLEEKLKNLDEKELKGKAVTLSKWLFNNYMECVFRGLGFNQNWNRGSIKFTDNLEHYLGKNWWNSERVTMEIAANVSTSFREAFLMIGIIENSEKEEDTLEWVNE